MRSVLGLKMLRILSIYNKQKNGSSGTWTRDRSFTDHGSTHYFILPFSGHLAQNSVLYMKKIKIIFLGTKKYQIRFVGNTDAINWVKFGYPVTSFFVKNFKK